MVIDRTGADVVVTTYTDKTKVEEHRAAVLAKNAEIVKLNQVVDEQLAALRKSLSDNTLALAAEADADKKAALQADIDKLKAKIAETEAKRQPLTVIIGPTKFTTRDAADAYVEQVKASAKNVRVNESPDTAAAAAK